jgi:Ala-tRNA(Pro) deacylase
MNALRQENSMELYNGRPQNTEGRLPREIRTYDLLDSLGIAYKEEMDNSTVANFATVQDEGKII